METLASLTGSSLVWGSPEYMAPELFGRGRADPRSDLFSFGVMLLELVAGRLPWKDRSLAHAHPGGLEESPLPRSARGRHRPARRRHAVSVAGRPSGSAGGEVVAALEGRAPGRAGSHRALRGCGVARAEDVPRCFACGTRTSGSTPDGGPVECA